MLATPNMHPIIKKSIELASKFHNGQFRKDEKTPCIVHPTRVAFRVIPTPQYIATAFLHDIIEDTSCRPDFLRMQLEPFGILGDKVFKAVITLTKFPGEDYQNYLEQITTNYISLKVKIHDIEDNLSDDPSPNQIEKYTKAREFLLSKIQNYPL